MSDLNQALLLQMSASIKGLEKAMKDGGNVVSRESRAMEKRAKQASDEIDKAFGGAMKNAQLGAAVAFGAISAYALKAASDANELESAFQVAFKTGAQEAGLFAEKLAKRVGRSVIDVKGQMTDLGLVISGMGLDAQQSMQMVKALTERAIDIGSLFNVDDADAMRAVISGLTGETEPLKRFGAVVNETAVQAELLRLGFKGNAQQAPEAAKAVARYNLIMQKTAVAQGDATNTAGSMANQMKRAQGEFKDAAIALGVKFVPAATDAIKAATGMVTAFTNLPTGVQLTSLALLGLAGASGPILSTVKALRALIVAATAAKVAVASVGAGGATGAAAKGAAAGGLLSGSLATGGVLAFAAGTYIDSEAQKEIERYQQLVHSRKSQNLKAASDSDLAFAQGYAEKALKHYQTPGLVGGDFQKEGIARIQNELDLISTEITRRAEKATGAIDGQAAAALQLLDTQLNAVNGTGTGGASLAGSVKKTAQEAAQLKASLDSVITALSTPDERAEQAYAEQVKVLTEAMQAGILTATGYADAVQRARAAANAGYDITYQFGGGQDRDIVDTTEGMDAITIALTKQQKAYNDVADAAESSFTRAKGNLKDFVGYFLEELQYMLAAAAAADLGDLIFGKRDQNGNRSGGLGSVLHSLKIPGFATGTNFAPGGLAYVHKDELIDLPRGSRVYTAAQTRNLFSSGLTGSADSSLRRMAGARASIVQQHFTVNAQGAILASDIVADIRRTGLQAAQIGTYGGAQLARTQEARRARAELF